jgi:hypothetical protein
MNFKLQSLFKSPALIFVFAYLLFAVYMVPTPFSFTDDHDILSIANQERFENKLSYGIRDNEKNIFMNTECEFNFGRFRPVWFIEYYLKGKLFGSHAVLYQLAAFLVGLINLILFYRLLLKAKVREGIAVLFVLILITGHQSPVWYLLLAQEKSGAFFLLLAVTLLVSAIQSGSKRKFYFAAFLLLLGSLSKEPYSLLNILVVASFGSYEFFFGEKKGRFIFQDWKHYIISLAVLSIPALVIFYMVFVAKNIYQYDGEEAFLFHQFKNTMALLKNCVYFIPVVLAALMLRKEDNRELRKKFIFFSIITVAWAALIFIIHFKVKLAGKYLFPAVLFPLAFNAWCMNYLFTQNKKYFRAVAIVLSFIFIYQVKNCFFAAQAYKADAFSFRHLCDELVSQRPEQIVVYSAGDEGELFHSLLENLAVENYFPKIYCLFPSYEDVEKYAGKSFAWSRYARDLMLSDYTETDMLSVRNSESTTAVVSVMRKPSLPPLAIPVREIKSVEECYYDFSYKDIRLLKKIIGFEIRYLEK